jgi:hypothetical protein
MDSANSLGTGLSGSKLRETLSRMKVSLHGGTPPAIAVPRETAENDPEVLENVQF